MNVELAMADRSTGSTDVEQQATLAPWPPSSNSPPRRDRPPGGPARAERPGPPRHRPGAGRGRRAQLRHLRARPVQGHPLAPLQGPARGRRHAHAPGRHDRGASRCAATTSTRASRACWTPCCAPSGRPAGASAPRSRAAAASAQPELGGVVRAVLVVAPAATRPHVRARLRERDGVDGRASAPSPRAAAIQRSTLPSPAVVGGQREAPRCRRSGRAGSAGRTRRRRC